MTSEASTLALQKKSDLSAERNMAESFLDPQAVEQKEFTRGPLLDQSYKYLGMALLVFSCNILSAFCLASILFLSTGPLSYAAPATHVICRLHLNDDN